MSVVLLSAKGRLAHQHLLAEPRPGHGCICDFNMWGQQSYTQIPVCNMLFKRMYVNSYMKHSILVSILSLNGIQWLLFSVTSYMTQPTSGRWSDNTSWFKPICSEKKRQYQHVVLFFLRMFFFAFAFVFAYNTKPTTRKTYIFWFLYVVYCQIRVHWLVVCFAS